MVVECRLRGHSDDYADTFGKLDRLTPILKERSGKKNYLGVFTYPISFKLKYENGGLPKAKILCPRTV